MGADRVTIIENGARASSGACRAADRPRSCGLEPASWSIVISAAPWSGLGRGVVGHKFSTNKDGQPLQDPNAAVSDGRGGAYFTDADRFGLYTPSTGRVYHLRHG
jgi:sugar lactone lactonase YvrE